MKDIILDNGIVKAHVNAFGAELKGLEMDGLEYLWQGDPKYYGRTSPTLFPIMGRFLSDTYYVKDRAYHMTINGFAMDRNFTPGEITDVSAEFELCDDERTRQVYPFAFRLRVRYVLDGQRMKVAYCVENRGKEPLPFCVGCHTAYRWPLEGTDPDKYRLRFESRADIASFNPFNWKDPSFVRDGYRPLSHDLFRNYTRSMRLTDPGYVEYGSESFSHGVRIHRDDFPFMAVWTLPDPEAELICLEPSTSVHAGAATTIEDRAGTLVLEPGGTCVKAFSIELF